jgi:hypothetical protein
MEHKLINYTVAALTVESVLLVTLTQQDIIIPSGPPYVLTAWFCIKHTDSSWIVRSSIVVCGMLRADV